MRKLNHIAVSNNLANIAAVCVLNNNQITALQINAPDRTVTLVLLAGATRALVILAHN
ncbi:13951_t:CDS:2, partial [Funneliformis caledonium]